ncbi:GAF domain-containing protein [Staphylococcus cohnii]|uniref:Free methionine-(R)-sulfoxide reductase n=2 Tax=Staphylococcus cohnii TaxID=29382 RepID=A0A0M2P628_STACC|nr:GAF domain-containing protein [Staphylococcus cohnii]TGP62451.1 GAF domain-containing protein [bacterium M00.F.Ca.ET.229.01.1.1]TGS39283.1 GAF domain-containing protein [bacterium M00.F.Ca.ET.180.01.1.1]AYX90822.1 GAF domain-containing protein [Staphylococcus cohnii]KKI65353.1 Free methionine-(R)-sulfoxide reductase [Staphylococcus cohnii subsp. cohnii]MDE1710612.1 GAF domain-containing protein [Staphylococcus cohnii]
MTNNFTNYGSLAKQLVALIEDEVEPITIFSNISSLLYSNLPNVNWLGFYFIKNEELLLGPFQGQPACSHLKLESGVCGDAVTQRNLINVEDVYEYPNHIFCDSNSKSEIVLPIFVNNTIIGVLDIDAPTINRFNKNDEVNLQNIVELIEKKLAKIDLSIMTDVSTNFIKK